MDCMGMGRTLRVIVISKVLIFISLIVFVPDVLSAGEKDRKNLSSTLTKEFKEDGWPALKFEATGQNYKTIRIEQNNVTQKPRLEEGQLISGLGTILNPKVVQRLKKAGFERGEYVDGLKRIYPFEISTKYHNELQNVLKSLSGR